MTRNNSIGSPLKKWNNSTKITREPARGAPPPRLGPLPGPKGAVSTYICAYIFCVDFEAPQSRGSMVMFAGEMTRESNSHHTDHSYAFTCHHVWVSCCNVCVTSACGGCRVHCFSGAPHAE